jgi:hypothetical protein
MRASRLATFATRGERRPAMLTQLEFTVREWRRLEENADPERRPERGSEVRRAVRRRRLREASEELPKGELGAVANT